MSNVPNDKVVVLGPKKFDFMTQENYKVATYLGYNSYKVTAFPAKSGGQSHTSDATVVFSELLTDGFVSSTPKIRTKVTVKITNFQNGAIEEPALIAGLSSKIGFLSTPVSRMIKNLGVRLNGGALISNNPSEECDLIVHGSNPHNLALSTSASAPDKYDAYTTSSISNPLASGADVENSELQSRGLGSYYPYSFSDFVIGTPGAAGVGTPSTINLTITVDQVVPSPAFQYENVKDAQPFFQLANLEISMGLNDVFESAIAVAGTYNQNNRTFTMGETDANKRVISFGNIDHKLVVHGYNPSVKLQVPRNLVYGGHSITIPYTQRDIMVSAGVKNKKITLNSFVLNDVPQMFAIVVRRPRVNIGSPIPPSSYTNRIGAPNSFLPITNVSIDMDNRTDLLRELNQRELYEMSTKNGLVDRYATFAGEPSSVLPNAARGNGSIFLFKPSNLSLNEGTVAGANMYLPISANVTVNSVSTSDENCTLQFYAIYDHLLRTDGKTFTSELPKLSKMNFVAADVKMVDDSSAVNHLVGGSSWGDIWGWMRRAAMSPFAKAASKFARNNLPVVSDFVRDGTALGNMVNQAGYGKGTRKKGGQILKLGGRSLTGPQLEALLVE